MQVCLLGFRHPVPLHIITLQPAYLPLPMFDFRRQQAKIDILKTTCTFVFQELVDQTPLVCKKWRELCDDSKVWDTLDLHHHHEVSESRLRRIVWLHCSTRKLILRYRRDLSQRTMIWCFFHLKNLRALDLSHCPQVSSINSKVYATSML